MAKHAAPSDRPGLRLFRRRRADDLLQRSLRSCRCGADVHVFAETCRHCGRTLELAS